MPRITSAPAISSRLVADRFAKGVIRYAFRPVLIIAVLLVLTSQTRLFAQNLPSGFAESLVTYFPAGTLPTDMAFAPDGRIFITQKYGALRVFKNGALLSQPFVFLNVDGSNERGLLAVTFDPDFTTNGYVYVYYTVNTTPIHNRISRFTADPSNPDVALAGSEFVLMDIDPVTTSYHNAGCLKFGSDGKLYVAVGNDTVSANSQILSNRLGKVLRINKDGTIPADNPFYNSATGDNRAIWTLGLRNPFRLNVQPGTGRIFIADVGESSWEEINDGIAGANFGWPNCEGTCSPSNPSFTDPIYAYAHGNGDVLGRAITGGAFYNPTTPQFPSDYVGKYFFGDYVNKWIQVFDPATKTTSPFATGTLPYIVDLEVGADGSLYYLTINGDPLLQRGALYKIQYTGNHSPQIGTQPDSQTVSEGKTVTFIIRASGDQPLSYQWQENGAPIAGATSASYTTPAVAMIDSGAQFNCVVTNSFGTAVSNSATLTVTPNQPPAPTITAPLDGAKYNAGDIIYYSGTGTDPEDGTLPPSAFTWEVRFQHNTHYHPFIAATSGSTSGSFTIPATGETSDDVWYRILLTVTDSSGASTTTYRDIFPNKSTISLATNPSGLQVTLDGTPQTTPYSVVGVVGMTRRLGIVSPQTVNGVTYQFVSWSDGGATTHNISTQPTDTTYTANFVDVSTITNGAAFVSQSVPASMNSGQTYNVSVTMQNTGTSTWPAGYSYRLGSQSPQDNTAWGFNRVSLATSVTPGDIGTFNFTVTAPATAGNYNFQWRMVQDGVQWFGDITPNVVVAVSTAPNAAKFVSQSVPTSMTGGQSYNVSVTMQNTGTNTWPAGSTYRLGSQNPQDNFNWGLNRVNLQTSVAPGASVTFNFMVTAPSTVGNYNFQWRMLQEGVQWFGDFTPNVIVNISTAANAATFVSQSVPASMISGQGSDVSITLKNTGTSTWPAASAYRLGSQNPQDNFTWGANRVYLPTPVTPGDTITLTFSITAPASAGSYNFQWRMLQEGVQWFGDFTPNVAVNVRVAAPQVTQQPADQAVALSKPATFSVSATGDAPLSYQWQRNGVNISGATSSSYTITSVTSTDSGAQFRCVVTNSYGTITSNSATVRIIPSITSQPSNATVALGQTATFSVAANGDSPLSYQWRKNGVAISGANSASYTTPPVTASDNSALFDCVVTNAYGGATSNSASLSVTVSVTLSTAPAGFQVTYDSQAVSSPASFTSVIGTSHSIGVTSPQTVNGTTYVFSSWSDGGAATHNISTPSSNTTYTATFNLVTPQIVQQPMNQTVAVGQPATFSVSATGGTPLSYQWQRNGVNIAGATSSSYTIGAVATSDSGAQFRCIVTNSYGSATSSVATLLATVTISLTASPAGLQVTWDGQNQITPYSNATVVVGSAHTIGAVSLQTINGVTYEFDSWSDGGASTHNITVPDINTTYSAVFRVKGGSIGTGTGLSGAYYDNMDFTGTLINRLDRTISFDWGTGSPIPSISPGTYSVRWTGQLQAQFSEMYTFYTQSSDGVRLWVDGKLIVNNWTNHAQTENSGTIRLKAGQKYTIKLEYYKNIGSATIKLLWSSQSTPKSIVPMSQLYAQ